MKNKISTKYILLAGLLIAFTIASRFISLEGVPQFNALLATTALFGFLIPNKKISVLVVLFMMVISDFIFGSYAMDLTLINYSAIVLVALMSSSLGNYNFKNSMIAATLAPVVFFLVSNAGVWLTAPEYSKDLSGLMNCYAMGIPFAKGTVIGSFVYSALYYLSYKSLFVPATLRK